MGRKRKVGPPRGRAGGRKSVVPSKGCERKRRTLYCTAGEYKMARLLVWLTRVRQLPPAAREALLKAYLPTRYRGDDEIHEIRLVDLDAILWTIDFQKSVPPINEGIENLLKTGNVRGDIAHENSTDA